MIAINTKNPIWPESMKLEVIKARNKEFNTLAYKALLKGCKKRKELEKKTS